MQKPQAFGQQSFMYSTFVLHSLFPALNEKRKMCFIQKLYIDLRYTVKEWFQQGFNMYCLLQKTLKLSQSTPINKYKTNKTEPMYKYHVCYSSNLILSKIYIKPKNSGDSSYFTFFLIFSHWLPRGQNDNIKQEKHR